MSKGTAARAILVGRMGGDAEVKTIKGDTKVANFSVAVTSGYGDSASTSWFSIQVFGAKRIQALVDYAGKGTKLFIDGELRVRSYVKDDVTRYVTEITVGYDGMVEIVSSKEENGRGSSTASTGGQTRPAPQPAFDSDLDDDVPF